MKSVIQEGSSLAKAIEQGWIKAGRPREFSIKIYQEPKKNFLGLTTQVAKVGIFFKDESDQGYQKREGHYQQRHRGQQQRHHQQQHRKRFFKNDERRTGTNNPNQNAGDNKQES